MTASPAGLPAPSERVAAVRRVARLWDDAIAIPGTSFRVGLDALLGLVPGLGDAAGAVVAGWIVVVAWREGAPPTVLARMVLIAALDAVLGAVPLAGDVADFVLRANRRNVALLDAWLAAPDHTARRSGMMLAAIAAAGIATLAGALVLAVVAVRALWRVIVS